MAQQLQWTTSEPHFPLNPTPVPTSPSGILDDKLASSSTAESSLACLTCGGRDKGCQGCGKKKLSHASASTPLMHKKYSGYGTSAHQITSSDETPSDLEMSVRCVCHQPRRSVSEESENSRRARNKLIIACIIALAFTVAEVLGGYFSHSLAIMTDAAHMLSDFASFLISLFSIWMATLPPSRRMSFGWHRAEVVGAVISVLIIWLVTGVLVYEAILRIINKDKNINADIMLITACISVFVNVFMCMVLGHSHSHGGGHGHSHGGGHGHSHGHDEGREESVHADENHAGSLCPSNTPCDAEEGGSVWKRDRKRKRKAKKADNRNINVRAAFIHTIGDLIQSLGVLLAAYIIKFRPDWYFADPICTFIFSVLVMISTITVLRDAMLVLMEGTPRHINYEFVLRDLNSVDGVKLAHNLHIWSLTMSKTAAAAHLALDSSANTQDVLDRASLLLQNRHGIDHTTLQVEDYQEAMENCRTCQRRPKGSPPRATKNQVSSEIDA